MHPRDTPCTGLLVAPGARSGRSSRFVFTVSDHPAELLLIVIGEPEDALKIPFILVSGFMLFSSEAMKCGHAETAIAIGSAPILEPYKVSPR